jgi:hypothetical protein
MFLRETFENNSLEEQKKVSIVSSTIFIEKLPQRCMVMKIILYLTEYIRL